MSRPPLPLGTHGDITVTKVRPTTWEARCRYRDLNGVVSRPAAWGPLQVRGEAHVARQARNFFVQHEQTAHLVTGKRTLAEFIGEVSEGGRREVGKVHKASQHEIGAASECG